MDLELKDISEAIGKLDVKSQEAVKTINDRIETLVKGAATKDEIKAFQEQLAKHGEDVKAVDDFAREIQKQMGSKQVVAKNASFDDTIAEMISKNAEAIQSGKSGKVPMQFEANNYMTQKDMSFTNNTTGTVVAPDFDPTIYGQPYQVPHLRTMVRTGRTSSNAYNYVVATLKAGNPGPAAGILPGGLKPEVQFQFDGKIAPVIKIAGHCRLPEEMVDDIEGMTSYLQNYMPEEVLKVEDFEIIRGPGTTGHFNGLITQATTHVPSAGVNPAEPWDLLANGIAIQQNKWLPANRIMVNPINWMYLVTRKSTDGIYSYPTLISGVPLTISGLQVVPHPVILTDEYLIGDFTRAELKFRTGLTVRFYDQDQDNAIKNLITVVAEERAAFAVYYPDAFLKGHFTSTT